MSSSQVAPPSGSTPPPVDVEAPAVAVATSHEHHTSYVFARLRRDMPAPSKMRQHAIYGALMLSMVLCGWNEGSTGPLIPKLQEHYNVGLEAWAR
ncbi:hypothetical protein Q8F55_002065 [Vanrija albida]|uniref:Major facilitator superfamily (MFS) profile domain-containing protein n=1 Tax=Vanrija albida TaxID=181172 RepID=A0ABR3Q8R0_9TREE